MLPSYKRHPFRPVCFYDWKIEHVHHFAIKQFGISFSKRNKGRYLAMSAFTEYFEKPFLVMCSILMQQSGLSENLINMALGMSHVHIIYDDPTDRKLGDIHIVVNLAAEKLPVGIEQPKTGFSISVADAILFALGDIDELPKSKKEPFGKAIRSLIISMCTYSINIYTRLMAHNRQAQETAFVTGMSVSEPNPEVEVNDMDEEDLKDILSEL